jgi:hypothetical protein
MDKTRVYVETTIPSFYHERRTTPDIVARRDWTRQWWDDATERHELVTSVAVLDELGDGPPEHRAVWLALMNDLPLLAIDSAVFEIVETYIRHRLMPATPGGGPPSGTGFVSQVRFSRYLELSAPGERE